MEMSQVPSAKCITRGSLSEYAYYDQFGTVGRLISMPMSVVQSDFLVEMHCRSKLQHLSMVLNTKCKFIQNFNDNIIG